MTKKSNSNAPEQSDEYVFSKDWFSNNIPRWEKHLKKLIKTGKNNPLKALEIGSFEGRSAIWTLENILVHPDSKITCIDNYNSITSSRKRNISKQRFLQNTKKFGNKVSLVEEDSRDALKTPELLNKQFDFIYIDASRHSKNVLEDAILSLPLLKVGGYIVFDDYTSSKEHDYSCPKKGIDTFLDIFHDEMKVENTSWQVIARKKASSRKLKPCHSELFARSVKTDAKNNN
jgi:predicted O-methyltransferase YrrM